MASRTPTCLRIASRQLGLSSRASTRSVGSFSKTRQYPASTAPRAAAATTSTASKPATSASRSTPSPASKPAATSSTASTTPSSSKIASSASPPVRDPIPAVSGVPLPDAQPTGSDGQKPIDWSSSYHGLGTSTFEPEVATVLQAPLDEDDIEVKPDGIIYLPEIKYRRVLNAAFGPGGWGLAPRGDLVVQERLVSRDYALIVHGR